MSISVVARTRGADGEADSSAGRGLCSPTFDPDRGTLLVCNAVTGGICVVDRDTGEIREWANTGGQPSGLAFDGGQLYAADTAAGAILSIATDGTASPVVSDFELSPLLGPCALAFGQGSGDLFFVDGGPLGTTTLDSPKGAVYSLASDARLPSTSAGAETGVMLRQVLPQSLAAPSGIATGPKDEVIYVSELLQNRVLRLVRRPAGSGAFLASVFVQLSGRVGPSCVACDSGGSGKVYVGRWEPRNAGGGEEGAGVGLVSAFLPDGTHERDFEIPDAPEISGVAIEPGGEALLVTETTTGAVYRIEL